MKYFWIIIGLLLLDGCARFQSQPISPADTATAWDHRSLSDDGFRKFLEKNLHREFTEWPLREWDFEKLTLAAFYFHPSLDVARAQWQVASGGEITAAQIPNPTLTATPGYDITATSIGLNPWIPGVTFDLPIEMMGKRRYRKAQAQQVSESARLNISTTAWQVRSNLRTALVEFTAARQREQLLEKQGEFQEQIVGSMEERIKAGAATSSEITLSRLALNKLKLDLADARRQKSDARFHVADAIGVSGAALQTAELSFTLSEAHPVAMDYLSAAIRDEALRSRTDILGALADYAASQAALQLEIAKQYPDIHFGPGYQFNQGDHQFTLAISATLPLFNQNQGPIAEATAHRAELAARFNALQAKVINELDRAVAAYRVSVENYELLKTLADAQKQQSDAVAAQEKAGAADKLDLLNSQLELAASGLVQLDGRLKLEQAFDALEDAVQRPIPTLNSETLRSPRAQTAMKETQP